MGGKSTRSGGDPVKRIAMCAAVAAFLLATVLPGTALAHTFVASTSLTIHKVPGGVTNPGATVVVYGKLRSVRPLCRSDRVVKLMRARPGADQLLAKDRTDSEGEYIFIRHPRRDQHIYTRFSGFFQTSYGHSHRCRGSFSSILFVNVG
jgi:hypothetical protein